MEEYLRIVKEVLENGNLKSNRTGVDTISISGAMFEHDMSQGFPLLTTKDVPLRLIASELEFFIKGITDKKWLQDRNNHIWDEWCSPLKVPYGHDEETKRKMFEERDLGPIYGFQWRHFGAKYIDYKTDYTGQGVDQLANLVNKLKQDSESRRLIVNSWNAADLDKMALPPCHDSFQVLANPKTKKLDFIWRQRSTDTMVGLPFNIASYALLQNLLAQEVGYVPGKLIGHLGDVHIYLPHIENAKIQLERAPYELPEVKVENFSGIFNCNYLDIKAKNYRRHPKLEYEVIT